MANSKNKKKEGGKESLSNFSKSIDNNTNSAKEGGKLNSNLKEEYKSKNKLPIDLKEDHLYPSTIDRGDERASSKRVKEDGDKVQNSLSRSKNYSTRNEYRSSFNTQGFDESIYSQRSLGNQRGGSGYSGSSRGGVGMGSFRRYRNEGDSKLEN